MNVLIILLGIFLAVISTFMFNYSPILEKQALNTMDEVSLSRMGNSIKKMMRNRKWLIGFIIGYAGVIPYIIAVYFVGIVVVQPLTNFGFILLVIMAKKYLNENLDKLTKIVLILMIIMPFFIGLANISEPTNDILQPGTFIILLEFSGILLGSSVIFLFLSKKFSIFYTIVVGIIFTLSGVFIQSLTYLFNFANEHLLFFILLAIFSLIIDLSAVFIAQIGLQKIAASKFVPIQSTITTSLTVFAGLFIYGQIVGIWAFYIVALIITFLGTIVLGRYQIPEKKIN